MRMQFGCLRATMRTQFFRFDLYLCLVLVLGLGAGCKSDPSKYSRRDQASLRLFLEVNPDGSDSNQPVLIGREQPFSLNVECKSFLTEFIIEMSAVVDTVCGVALS